MDIKYIESQVDFIKNIAGDDEMAHGKEDSLRAEFIEFIANNDYGDLSKMAAKILETDDIDFCRWCA